mgnify:CR=1 FL=1
MNGFNVTVLKNQNKCFVENLDNVDGLRSKLLLLHETQILQLASQLSDVLGINDLLKLRDHVELKIREIYEETK